MRDISHRHLLRAAATSVRLRVMSDLDRSAGAWSHSMEAVIALGAGLADDGWARQTECPEWTVKDVYAHLVGGEVWMSRGHPKPATGLARIADEPVHARRVASGPEVLAELREVYALRSRQVREQPLDPDAPTHTAYLAPVTVAVLYRMRAFDVWVHEQDVRRALGVPGNLDSPAAEISREIFMSAMPRVVAKLAGAPAGASVRFTVTGPVAFDQVVEVGADGRGRLAPGPTQRPETVRLSLDWETFSRLAAGRIRRASAAVDISGERDLAERVLSHLAVTP